MAQRRNPFRYLRPVPPEEFLGRRSIIQSIVADMVLDEGDSHAIIGGRRFGKSSLLAALHYHLRQPETQQGDHVVLPLFIDFKRTFVSEAAFFGHVLREICRRIDVNAQGRIKDPSPIKITLDRSWLEDLPPGNSRELSLTQFEEAVSYLLDELYRAGGPTRLVLLLDEVDDILDHDWHKTLFNQLRSLVYSGDMADYVRLVLSGSRRFLDSVTDRGSPLWNILNLHYLNTFDQDTTYELAARAENLSESIHQSVWEQSGGHPFLAQYLLHYLWRSEVEYADEETVAQIVNRFLHEEQAHLEGWASGVEGIGLDIYRYFVDQPAWIDEMRLIKAIDAEPNVVKRGLVALSYHGFIVHDGAWTQYRRTGHIFRQWYLAKFGIPEPFTLTAKENTLILAEEDKIMQPTVFVSYSQADEREKDQLLSHLGVLQTADLIDVWSDDRIAAGADWEAEIGQAIAQAKVAVLLISASFLTTDFIVAQAIPALLQRREDEGLVVFPVIAKACAWQKIDWLDRMSVRPRNRRPVWSDGGSHADEDLATIAEEIAIIVSQASSASSTKRRQKDSTQEKVHRGSQELDRTRADDASVEITQRKPHHRPGHVNTAKIRRLLNECFDDPGLDAFCQDYFPSVFDRFSRGMRKDEKITWLLDHCRRAIDGFESLLSAVHNEVFELGREELRTLLMALETLLK